MVSGWLLTTLNANRVEVGQHAPHLQPFPPAAFLFPPSPSNPKCISSASISRTSSRGSMLFRGPRRVDQRRCRASCLATPFAPVSALVAADAQKRLEYLGMAMGYKARRIPLRLHRCPLREPRQARRAANPVHDASDASRRSPWSAPLPSASCAAGMAGAGAAWPPLERLAGLGAPATRAAAFAASRKPFRHIHASKGASDAR